MPLSEQFPADPYVILDPAVRWYPGDELLGDIGRAKLIPPLVEKVRRGVKAWRDSGYAGASGTTRALLRWWFSEEHLVPQADGTMAPFRWHFAQREAVESAIWLYEVEQAREPYALITKYDSSQALARQVFPEDWARYVMKLATGAGKTKVMSLLMTWSYFHKLYEPESPLSTNFLLIAPNIIVLDRLRTDFDGARIFRDDPLLPPDGWEGQSWDSDFQLTVHIQDEIGFVPDKGNLFLTNIHRVYESNNEPSFDDQDTTDYFLGKKPVTKTTDSSVDLGVIIRDVSDLLILNDEAHHIHDPSMAWFQSIQDITMRLRQKGSDLSAQFDLTATPRHNDGSIFVQTISDYPLVEAIRQDVVKTPVLPDEASRAKLTEHQSSKFTERYANYLHLGYLEWKKSFDELSKMEKKAVLFVMTDDTRNCDEVAKHLEARYGELDGSVLVIHTKNNGEISEASSGKSNEELNLLREQSKTIDNWDNKHKAVVSVMVLREGWDVRNVTTIVGLRPYTSKAKILPEQTLGRGLRRMFRGENINEKVSVVGTQAFIDFVESIKSEGVDLEYRPMGERSTPAGPMVIEIDKDNKSKDLAALDIELPRLTARIEREYKNLAALDPTSFANKRIAVKQFTQEQQREIIFTDLDTGERSHVTRMDAEFTPTYQNVVGYFARTIMRDLRLVGGQDVLFGKIKTFIQDRLFENPVNLEDLNILRNLSEIEATRTIIETFKKAINDLTVVDRGTTQIRDRIRLSQARPYAVKQQAYLAAKKSIFNKVTGDGHFELEFAGFLDGCPDIMSFAKNSRQMNPSLFIEYRNADGSISNYFPDFIVKKSPQEIWIVETKGREDLDDPPKWERLKDWVADATARDGGVTYRAMFVREEEWKKRPLNGFSEAQAAFETA
ncbi:MAG TPA: DEAD/DEAH box helicase family protein [Pseudolabrys sp.]|nr:DEAD/DEAH box helicase family protein [Pseudolabrys sp.]